MSVFTLEALNAEHGDSLLLHYGSPGDPRLIVIDGGPKTVYRKALKPRLEEIRSARGGGKLEIRLLMVSHIDEDHIIGILDLTKDLRTLQESNAELPYDILSLWHNSFSDLIATANAEVRTQLDTAAGVISAESLTRSGGAVIASVRQGRQLRLDATNLSINLNPGFNELVVFDESHANAINMGQGLKFTVLGPRMTELDDLEGKWKKEVEAFLEQNPDDVVVTAADLKAIAADFDDDSIHNLSSIVVLAESDGRKMLLTGDARGDFIIDSLREAGLLVDDKIHIDILKTPHHGSFRNVEDIFFETVEADHYVFSANGKDGNPDEETLDLLFKVRPTGPYTLWLTNPVAERVAFIEENKPSDVTVIVRSDPARSVKVELGMPIGV